MSNVKTKLRKREPVFGAWTSLAHPQITEMFASIMKPDFVGIDVEHSTINLGEGQRIIAAGQSHGIPVFPRVASHNGEQIRRYLDSGADGIIVPMVNTPKEVDQIIQWIKYPPIGKRSYGVARAQGYGAQFEDYTKSWNEQSIFIIQIESIEAVEAADALLASDHVDGVMIGPYDISGSLGIPGKLNDAKVLRACDRVIEACARHNKACGTQATEPNDTHVKKIFDAGYTFVVLGSDIFLMWKWSEEMHGLMGRMREGIRK